MGFGKIAEEHTVMEQTWTREVQGAYSSARECRVRTESLVNEARRQLHKSDELLRWFETYGPRPKLQEAEDESRFSQ
jgi:hypothetical protein